MLRLAIKLQALLRFGTSQVQEQTDRQQRSKVELWRRFCGARQVVDVKRGEKFSNFASHLILPVSSLVLFALVYSKRRQFLSSLTDSQSVSQFRVENLLAV